MYPHIDLHCDTLYRLCDSPNDFFTTQNKQRSHVFFSGLQSSRTLLQCFSVFTDLAEISGESPLSGFQKQLSCFRQILASADGALLPVRSSAALKECRKQNKTGALLTLEESFLSETPLSLLPEFYSAGIRIATLTWDYSTPLGTSAQNLSLPGLSSSYPGLTPTGLDFLAEAERLGILIDVSHLSDAGFHEVAAHTKKPFLASHSNARTVCNVPRNLTDDMLRILGKRGGLVGLCFHEPFLLPSPSSPEDIASALLRHTVHILSVAGSDVLSLGTDFDGTPGNRFLPDITYLERLETLFKKGGLTTLQIEKIFYRNALRFLEDNLPAHE